MSKRRTLSAIGQSVYGIRLPRVISQSFLDIAHAARRDRVYVHGMFVRSSNQAANGSDVLRAIIGAGLRELASNDPRLLDIQSVREALDCFELTPEQWAHLP